MKRVRMFYEEINDFLSCMALLVYSAYSPKSNKLTCDMGSVVYHIDAQVSQFRDITDKQAMDGLAMVDQFNHMNGAIIDFKKENPDVELPYTVFDVCFWYFDALKVLQAFSPDQYPLVSGWPEFFMFLPELASWAEDPPKSVNLKMIKYQWMINKNQLEYWYGRKFGYERSPMDVPGFKQVYVEELSNMSYPEIVEELQKNNWGKALVQAEIKTRTKNKCSKNA